MAHRQTGSNYQLKYQASKDSWPSHTLNMICMSFRMIGFKYKLYKDEQRRESHRHEHEVRHRISAVFLQTRKTHRRTIQLSVQCHQITLQNHQ